MSGAKSASSGRLKKTWEVVKDRQAHDNGRFAWKPPSMSKGGPDGRSHSQPNFHDGLGAHIVDDEEGALIVLQQRRKYKASLRKMKDKYEELEDELFDKRRPPLLRTTGGEILQGIYPSKSRKWLGVPPRFGSVVPQEKYVGAQANELSKWISTDKIIRLQSEASLLDQPVRSYLKIDDSVDVHEMTGSHFRFMANPLAEKAPAMEAPVRRGASAMSLEDGASGSGYTESEEWDGGDDESAEPSLEEGWEDEVEEEEDEESEQGAIVPVVAPRNTEMTFEELDKKFARHCRKLSHNLQEDMRSKMAVVESKWREGQDTRPATLRFRR